MTETTTASPAPAFAPYWTRATLYSSEAGRDREQPVLVLEPVPDDPGGSTAHLVRVIVAGERQPRPIAVCRLTNRTEETK